GQWNITSLRKLLKDIFPKNTFLKGFEVVHEFPFIGRKIVILNARQVHFKENVLSKLFSSVILLAIEDVTEMVVIAETLAGHVNDLKTELRERRHSQQNHNGKLEK
ncbi:MAG: AAA family ATPase, partial [bacterium]|nr:AAA family ATPase [bacterium]